MRLFVELTPWVHREGLTELRVKVDTGDRQYRFSEVLPPDDFHSMLHRIMARAEREIVALRDAEAAPAPHAAEGGDG